ncbi:MAG: hypothetical protein HY013_02880 [Candidatus Solibacter usitatus]|nr:hypothetical protein [Candidatus Solibacter usitatus]
MRSILGLWLASSLWAAGTATWEMNNYQDFARGRFQGVSLTRDGQLAIAPRLDSLFQSDQPAVWAVVRAPDGTLYAATGHRGRVFRIETSGRSSLLWTAPEPEVFALALDSKGALYAASSPDGKVYRLTNGQAEEYFAPGVKYIWSLVAAPDGALYLGTGDQGKVLRVWAKGKGEVYYETGQSHVTSLALDAQGRLLAGSEPNGILYRIRAKDKAFVLYDANLPEIRAIVPAPDGSIYAAALGGSVARRSQSAAQAASGTGAGATVTAPATTITVTADAQAGAEVKPPADSAKPPQSAAAPQAATQPPPVVDVSGVEKSALYRINPDNTVETLWSSKEENAYDMLVQGGQILFSTDQNGRVYRLTPDRKLTLLVQTNESEAIRLLQQESSVLAATSNLGKIYRIGDQPGSGGVYESPVHDAGTVARWGRLEWRAEGTGLKFRTRSGNSLRPDRTWSEWSEPLPAPGIVTSPNARFIQWDVELSCSPLLDSVTLAYLPQNNPPSVKSITVLHQFVGMAGAAKPAAATTGTGAFSVTVTDTADGGVAPSTGTPTQTLSRPGAAQIQITWQAEDPDGDRLVYTLHFRGEDERQWKLLKTNFRENTYAVDADALADGRYLFRVTASDREANPPGVAREADLVSSPVLIDNTPPVVAVGAVRRSGAAVEIEVEAADAASPLRRCEYSLDAGPWIPAAALDGVIDSQREKFLLKLDAVPPGEHVVVVRAVDSANNAGLAKTVLRP